MADNTNKVAIVTGGTGALGRTIVNKFASEGMKVYVPTLTMDEFKKVFNETKSDDEFKLKKIYGFECNAIDENSVNNFVDSVAKLEKNKIDILVNTVGGIAPPKQIADMDNEYFKKMFDFNFMSTLNFTKRCLAYMKAYNFGRIVSIGALAALETTPARFAYGYAKAGVISLMDTVSEEMKDFNIRANTVVPSIIDTPGNREWGSEDDIKKWVKPEDIADIIYDLGSEKFKSVRNSIIKVLGDY
jgi:NAD(P)-dependent dehydrogenase (short-subunit alcohol dehydrogenase family)